MSPTVPSPTSSGPNPQKHFKIKQSDPKSGALTLIPFSMPWKKDTSNLGFDAGLFCDFFGMF